VVKLLLGKYKTESGNNKTIPFSYKELDGPAISAPRRAIAEVKQRWSVIGWVTKDVLSRTPSCFGRHKAVGPGSICSRQHPPTCTGIAW
jgi:hypothetical protein